MASFASLKAAAVLFLVAFLALFASTIEKRRPANIDGFVYQECANYRLVGPVSGAVVSTSLDTTTATTDAAGHFHLVTKNPVFGDEFYEVTVRSGDVVVDDNFPLTHIDPRVPASSPVRLTFVLSPPEPVAASPTKSGEVCHSFPPGRAGAKQQGPQDETAPEGIHGGRGKIP
jgi:hypothetical protein